MTSERLAILTVVIASALSQGCALLNKAEPVTPDYLTPSPATAAETLPVGHAVASGVALRLRRVRAADHLSRRVVVRDGGHEVRFLERTRWTDPPRDLVERRIARTLFETWGLTRIVGGDGYTLEVTVGAFALDHSDPDAPEAVVELTGLLHDERRALFQKTITRRASTIVDRGDDGALRPGAPFAQAMSRALDDAIAELAEATVAAIEQHDHAVATSEP